MKAKDKFLAALDAGSAKTCALVAEIGADGSLVFRAFGTAESRGWRKGLIVNLDAAVKSIRTAVESAEQALGAPVEHAVVGVGASQVKGVNSRGGISVSSRHREIQREDVRRAVDEARKITVPPDFSVVHVIPQEFVLDTQDSIRDPVGMVGSRLEANVHIVRAATGALTNLVSSVNRAGLVVDESVLEPLAAAEAVLDADERELGVAVADIGAGSTDVVVFRLGSLQHSFTVPIGGDHFTNDIAVGLRTPIPEAEKIKQSFGVATTLLVGENTQIEVPSVGDRPSRLVPHRDLGDILEPRAEELMRLIRDELMRAGLHGQLGGGIVLTGGGALLRGMCDIAEQVLDAQARIGLPARIHGAPEFLGGASYSTLIGLLFFAQRVHMRREADRAGLGGWFKTLFAAKA